MLAIPAALQEQLDQEFEMDFTKQSFFNPRG